MTPKNSMLTLAQTSPLAYAMPPGSRFLSAALAIGLVLSAAPLHAQGRGAAVQAKEAHQEGRPAHSASILERAVSLNRAQTDELAKELASAAAASSKPSRGFGGILGDAVKGNQHRQNAAIKLLELEASREAAKGRTAVVVIGSDDDRLKVRESLSQVTRDVVLMFVDLALSDSEHDNSALRGGLLAKVTGLATNMWVYLPSSGDASVRKPNQLLSTKLAAPKLWTGVFAVNGDVPAELTNALNGQGLSAGRNADQDTGADQLSSASAVREGDVLTPKIPGVRLLARAADDAKVIATLTKADQVVVIGVEKDGFVQVQSAAGGGWTKALLFSKSMNE